MKEIIQQYLYIALQKACIDYPAETPIPIEYSRSPIYGEFSSSIALSLATSTHQKPEALAQIIVDHLKNASPSYLEIFKKIVIVKPGFINFFIQPKAWLQTLADIVNAGNQYGHAKQKAKETILIEFVSSNPTGPLHIGHGRAASHGDIVARLLKTQGYQVHTEYYINDAGRQIDILSCSLWLRYLEILGEQFVFPSNAYQGQYIYDLAQELKTIYGNQWHYASSELQDLLGFDAAKNLNPEKSMDALIKQTKNLLGSFHYQTLKTFALEKILEDIRSDLNEFEVKFDRWFSENTLIEDGSLSKTIALLIKKGHTYQLDGTLWFRSTSFGDDKDRVLLRANGEPTYFAVDAAYRFNIFQQRKFNKIINFLGADHHGYLTRIHAVIEALGYSKNKLVFNTLQLVSLYQGHKKLPLSTRSGDFITLRALRNEVGHDAARLFFVLRKSSQMIDFDMTLAKSHSHQNPVYYLQYAYARICSVIRQLKAKGFTWELQAGLKCLEALRTEELLVIKQLARYPYSITQASDQCEPYLLVQYLRDLAKDFHAYYDRTPILVEDQTIRNARLTLIHAIQSVLKNGFDILGIQALEVL